MSRLRSPHSLFAPARSAASLYFSRSLCPLPFCCGVALYASFAFTNLGWAAGAENLYGPFQIVQLTNSVAQLPADTRMLVLGADDKNLVVLVRGYHQPQYLSRSDTKTFRIVGLA